MFGNILKKINKVVDETEQIDDRFYAEVMDELSQGFKDKAAVGKAIAQADGNEAKFNSIYMKIRAATLQEKFFIKEEHQLEIHNQKIKLFQKIHFHHDDGYFHKLFKKEIETYEFTVNSWLLTLKKDGINYNTEIDYENMDFLIINKKKEVLHRFHFEVNHDNHFVKSTK